jgi:hypothetical protein
VEVVGGSFGLKVRPQNRAMTWPRCSLCEGEELYEAHRFPEPPPARFDGPGPHRNPEAAQQPDADHLGLHPTGDALRPSRAAMVPHPSIPFPRGGACAPSLPCNSRSIYPVRSARLTQIAYFSGEKRSCAGREPASASRT